MKSLHGENLWKNVCLLNDQGSPGGSDSKESACNVGDLGWLPGVGRSPGGGHGNPFQYSCLNDLERNGGQQKPNGEDGALYQPPRSLLGNHHARPASVLGEKRLGLLRSCCLPCACHLIHSLEHSRWLDKEPLELGNQRTPHCIFSWPNMSSLTNRWARWSLGCWKSLIISVYILLIFLILTCNLTLKKIRRYRWARREWKSLVDHPCWLFGVCPLRLFYAYLLYLLYSRWDCSS